MEIALNDYVERYEHRFNQLSFGKINPKQLGIRAPHPELHKYWQKIAALISNSQKKIILEHSPIDRAGDEEIKELGRKSVELWQNMQFKKAIEAKNLSLKKIAEQNIERDLHFVNQITQILNENPNNIILAIRGLVHTWVYHELSRRKINVKKYFSIFPVIFSWHNEIVRRNIFGKPVFIEDVIKCFFESNIDKSHGFDVSPEYVALLRKEAVNSAKIFEKSL